MTISRGNYTFRKPTAAPEMSLSDAATKLGITIQRCSRLVKRFEIPLTRIGYLLLIGPDEFIRLKNAFQHERKKKKAKAD